MVIFFTGTGSSEYLANAIADRPDDCVVSSNEIIKSGEKRAFVSEKPWVFVFPYIFPQCLQYLWTLFADAALKEVKKHILLPAVQVPAVHHQTDVRIYAEKSSLSIAGSQQFVCRRTISHFSL